MCNHPHVHVTRPDGAPDRFDEDIYPLVNLMFEQGIMERFSCQGDPFFVDQTRYEARDHRAYIMVEATPEAYTFLSNLAISYPGFREETRSWSIEIDQEPLRKFMSPERHNPKPRIIFRFPHQDILKLTVWMLEYKERMNLLDNLGAIYSSTGEEFNDAAIEELLRSETDGKD